MLYRFYLLLRDIYRLLYAIGNNSSWLVFGAFSFVSSVLRSIFFPLYQVIYRFFIKYAFLRYENVYYIFSSHVNRVLFKFRYFISNFSSLYFTFYLNKIHFKYIISGFFFIGLNFFILIFILNSFLVSYLSFSFSSGFFIACCYLLVCFSGYIIIKKSLLYYYFCSFRKKGGLYSLNFLVPFFYWFFLKINFFFFLTFCLAVYYLFTILYLGFWFYSIIFLILFFILYFRIFTLFFRFKFTNFFISCINFLFRMRYAIQYNFIGIWRGITFILFYFFYAILFFCFFLFLLLFFPSKKTLKQFYLHEYRSFSRIVHTTILAYFLELSVFLELDPRTTHYIRDPEYTPTSIYSTKRAPRVIEDEDEVSNVEMYSNEMVDPLDVEENDGEPDHGIELDEWTDLSDDEDLDYPGRYMETDNTEDMIDFLRSIDRMEDEHHPTLYGNPLDEDEYRHFEVLKSRRFIEYDEDFKEWEFIMGVYRYQNNVWLGDYSSKLENIRLPIGEEPEEFMDKMDANPFINLTEGFHEENEGFFEWEEDAHEYIPINRWTLYTTTFELKCWIIGLYLSKHWFFLAELCLLIFFLLFVSIFSSLTYICFDTIINWWVVFFWYIRIDLEFLYYNFYNLFWVYEDSFSNWIIALIVAGLVFAEEDDPERGDCFPRYSKFGHIYAMREKGELSNTYLEMVDHWNLLKSEAAYEGKTGHEYYLKMSEEETPTNLDEYEEYLIRQDEYDPSDYYPRWGSSRDTIPTWVMGFWYYILYCITLFFGKIPYLCSFLIIIFNCFMYLIICLIFMVFIVPTVYFFFETFVVEKTTYSNLWQYRTDGYSKYDLTMDLKHLALTKDLNSDYYNIINYKDPNVLNIETWSKISPLHFVYRENIPVEKISNYYLVQINQMRYIDHIQELFCMYVDAILSYTTGIKIPQWGIPDGRHNLYAYSHYLPTKLDPVPSISKKLLNSRGMCADESELYKKHYRDDLRNLPLQGRYLEWREKCNMHIKLFTNFGSLTKYSFRRERYFLRMVMPRVNTAYYDGWNPIVPFIEVQDRKVYKDHHLNDTRIGFQRPLNWFKFLKISDTNEQKKHIIMAKKIEWYKDLHFKFKNQGKKLPHKAGIIKLFREINSYVKDQKKKGISLTIINNEIKPAIIIKYKQQNEIKFIESWYTFKKNQLQKINDLSLKEKRLKQFLKFENINSFQKIKKLQRSETKKLLYLKNEKLLFDLHFRHNLKALASRRNRVYKEAVTSLCFNYYLKSYGYRWFIKYDNHLRRFTGPATTFEEGKLYSKNFNNKYFKSFDRYNHLIYSYYYLLWYEKNLVQYYYYYDFLIKTRIKDINYTKLYLQKKKNDLIVSANTQISQVKRTDANWKSKLFFKEHFVLKNNLKNKVKYLDMLAYSFSFIEYHDRDFGMTFEYFQVPRYLILKHLWYNTWNYIDNRRHAKEKILRANGTREDLIGGVVDLKLDAICKVIYNKPTYFEVLEKVRTVKK